MKSDRVRVKSQVRWLAWTINGLVLAFSMLIVLWSAANGRVAWYALFMALLAAWGGYALSTPFIEYDEHELVARNIFGSWTMPSSDIQRIEVSVSMLLGSVAFATDASGRRRRMDALMVAGPWGKPRIEAVIDDMYAVLLNRGIDRPRAEGSFDIKRWLSD